MPLSEREQQLLAQLEKQLNAEDPQFAHSMHARPTRPSVSTRGLVLGVVLAVVGLAVVIGGVAIPSVLVGLVGFLIMCFGVYWASTRRSGAPSAGAGATSRPRPPRQSSAFMRGLEQKWDERRTGER